MPATLTPVTLRLTPEEYFAWEETQEEKHDYIHGEVFSVSGASRPHNVLFVNLIGLIWVALRGSECVVYGSEMRVQVEEGLRYVYPDLSVVCGEGDYLGAKEHTLTNPTALVEILSDSTERYDRGEKLDTYREIPSLREIALVRQDRRAATVWRRDGTRWTVEDASDRLALESANVEVPFGELYAGVPGV